MVTGQARILRLYPGDEAVHLLFCINSRISYDNNKKNIKKLYKYEEKTWPGTFIQVGVYLRFVRGTIAVIEPSPPPSQIRVRASPRPTITDTILRSNYSTVKSLVYTTMTVLRWAMNILVFFLFLAVIISTRSLFGSSLMLVHTRARTPMAKTTGYPAHHIRLLPIHTPPEFVIPDQPCNDLL